MDLEELGPAERFAGGAIGTPGKRHFYLEVTTAGDRRTFLCEKAQLAELAAQGLVLLAQAGIDVDEEAVARLVGHGLEVEPPETEEGLFRVGSMTVAINPSHLILVTLESVDEDQGVAFVVAPEQFRAMAMVALQAVAAGRPTCPWCRLPMDVEGHNCPASNGHRTQ